MNVSRIPNHPIWMAAVAWVEKTENGNAAYIVTISKTPDLYRTMQNARDRLSGALSLLVASGLANDTPINIVSEIADLVEKSNSVTFDEQVKKKFLKLKKTNDCPF